jgi:hypothetical protein
MARRKRIKWNNGDVFAVPLVDGSFGTVQAIDHWLPHWIYTAVSNRRLETIPADMPALCTENVIALIAVGDDQFDFGGPAALLAKRGDFGNERYASNGYVGATSYSGGIIPALLSAWHGLAPWDAFKDARYLDKLLVSGLTRPANVMLNDSIS